MSQSITVAYPTRATPGGSSPKYLRKNIFRAFCGTRKDVSPRAEALQTCEGGSSWPYQRHAWKGWKETRFPLPHEGLPPSSTPANRGMDGFPHSSGMGWECLKSSSPEILECSSWPSRLDQWGIFLLPCTTYCLKPSPKHESKSILSVLRQTGGSVGVQQELLAADAKGRSLPRQPTADSCAWLKSSDWLRSSDMLQHHSMALITLWSISSSASWTCV